MLKSVVIKGLSTAQTRSITLSFTDPSSSYFIKQVDGLDPVDADISKTSYPGIDKDYFQSARVGGRTPSFQIGLRPNRKKGETVQSLRRGLYRVLPPKTPVRITINDDTMPQTYVDGYVKSVAPTIFSKSPDMVITILSMDAYLTSTTVLKNLIFQTNTVNKLNYLGDAPTPIEFTQTMVRPASYVTIRVNGAALLTVTYPFIAGDIFTFSTAPGGKYARRLRSGANLSILDSISTGSLDLFIDAATDTFAANNNYGTAIASEKFALTYSAKYLGV